MADPPEPTPDDPFSGLPLFGDLSRMLAGQGPINWDAARQFAVLSATGGTVESNVDPAARMSFEGLTPIAAMQVSDVTGIDCTSVRPELVTPGVWASNTLDAYRPLFTDLATSLSAPATEAPTDPMGQMFAGLSKMMGPAMLGMAVGSMVGDLARRAFGTRDLPIPRGNDRVELVPATIDAFAADWSIGTEQMRLWVLTQELAGQVVATRPNVRAQLLSLVQRHVGGFRPDPDAITERLGSLDMTSGDPMEALQEALGDPEVLLGAVRSPDQLELEPWLDAAVAAVVGLTDWFVDAVAVRVVGGEALTISEAVRRRRSETDPADVFIQRLLGIRVDGAQVSAGKNFVQGIVDRAGEDAVELLLSHAEP
ncbi:MAG: zinc-dependent metalloprotease, partial [Ilumatobacteraceae bacterium]